jgi:hypothetical protein
LGGGGSFWTSFLNPSNHGPASSIHIFGVISSTSWSCHFLRHKYFYCVQIIDYQKQNIKKFATYFLLLLRLAPQPLVRPWPPPQSSSIYPSPMPTQLVAAGSFNPAEFLEASQHFRFYRVGLLAPRPTPTLEDQASVFISPRVKVAQLQPQAPGTHFSRLLRHA